MAVTLESFLAVNFFVDGMLLFAVARAMYSVRPVRLALASAVGALLSLLALLLPSLRWPLVVAMPALLCAVGIPLTDLRELARAVVAFAAAGLILGGLAQVLMRPWSAGVGALVLTGALGGALYLMALRGFRIRVQTLRAQLELWSYGGRARFEGLLDTGNRHSEPLSGHPVIVVSEEALRRALPAGFDAHAAAKNPPRGWRLVAYGTLGGMGSMACYRPDRIRVSFGRGWKSATTVWVAVYPGVLPGGHPALVPPELARIGQDTPRMARRGVDGMG